MQVFVIGMHRSGTSALARILNLMGLYFGDERIGTGRSPENKKGFWERRDVRTLNDTILFAAGCDWDAVSTLDLDAIPDSARRSHALAAGDIVLNLDAHRPWFIKEPRLCVLLPVWREVVDVPVCIHVHRNPLEVADSLKARNDIPVRTGLALWEFYNSRALNDSAGLDRVFVSYEDLMRDPIEVVEKLHGALDGRENYRLRIPTKSELGSYLDGGLYRHRRTAKSLRAVATASQRHLYELLREAEGGMDPVAGVPPSESCLETLGRHELSVDIGERMERANEALEGRNSAKLEMQLALKTMELKHAIGSVRQESARLQKLERNSERLQRQRNDLTVNLALEKKHVAALERELSDLQAAKKDLEHERSELQHERSELQHERSELQRTNARLESDRIALDENVERLNTELGAERAGVEDAVFETSQSREHIRSTTSVWAAELKIRRDRLTKLGALANDLQTEIESLLISRRWRLGNTLVSTVRRLLLRKKVPTVVEQFSEARAVHRASVRMLREFATSENETLGDVARSLPTETPAVRKLLQLGDRHAELALGLIEHNLELRRRACQIDETRTRIVGLVHIFEAMVESRRWRLGDSILSFPRRLLRRGHRRTAVDRVRKIIDGYRQDGGDRGVNPLPAITPIRLKKPCREPAGAIDPVTTMPTSEQTKHHQRRVPHPALSAGVDVIVCVHDALDDVRRCLESVVANTTVDYRLIVVNDGSGTETRRWLEQFAVRWPVVQLIDTDGGPVGYTCAANLGLRASSMGKVVLLNSDAIVPRLWLEALLLCMASGDRVGIVGPLSNAASWQSIPDRFGGHGGWAVNDLPPGYNVDEFGELVRRVSESRFPRVAFLNGFCLLIDREVIDRVGYLDEESFPRGYGEENDYCIRAREAGFELAVADHCYVYHAKSKSFGRDSRDELARKGRQALLRKHGPEVIAAGTDGLRDSPELAAVRARLIHFIGDTRPALGALATRPKSAPVDGPNSVLFLLPVRGGSGGANSVAQEAAGMRTLGVNAQVAVVAKYADSMRHFYGELLDDALVVYDSSADLLDKAEPFDVVVATIWTTAEFLKPMSKRWPDKVLAYYVQDYEPWFYPEGSADHSAALQSYNVVPDNLLMAKTDWICRTVRERHGVEVCRVAASLDHDVFHPMPDPTTGDKTVTVAAMVRPKTPRRAPLRTLRVLRRVASMLPEVRIVLFGCETQEIRDHIDSTESDIRLDFDFVNHGVVTRDTVAGLLRSADVFLDLSDYQAFGRAGLEAMACGCAVVLPAHGGVSEYAIDGENACVVDTASDEAVEHAVMHLLQDRDLREKLKRQGIRTASRYDVVRASLSELSAFRLAWRHADLDRKPAATALRRAAEPVSVESSAAKVAVLVGLDGGGLTSAALEQRVLNPLRHRTLRNRVVVREVRSFEELESGNFDVCVVHDAIPATESVVDKLGALCRERRVSLVYAAGDVLSQDARMLAEVADRVVVPSTSLVDSYADMGADVRFVPAALDESLWLEHTVVGERDITERHRSDVTQVLFIGSEDELEIVLPAWRQVVARSEHALTLTLEGKFASKQENGVEVFPLTGACHEDHVRSLRARNQWDVGLLPATESSGGSDLRFLSLSALGVAVIGSDLGSHVHFAHHGENALLVGNTREDWVEGMLKVVSDAALREKLADQALYDLEINHTLNRRASGYFQAYAKVGEGIGDSCG